MTQFRGLFPPIITPFLPDGRLDERGLREHVDFMIENGSDGMCVGSSTGEFSTMDRAEWEKVVLISKEQARGRVPLLAGAACMSTWETVERAKFAEREGFDGLLVISPWYQVHTNRELYAHFKALRDAMSLPVMIYNNPPVAGVRLSFDLVERMANDGLIQYIKDADSDPFTISRLKLHLGDKLGLFYGHDNNAIGAFLVGATGWVSGSANFDPKRWSKLVHLCIDDRDFVAATKLWFEILPFMELVTSSKTGERADWIAVIKRGLELRGRRAGPVRGPMLPLTPEVDAEVVRAVRAMTF